MPDVIVIGAGLTGLACAWTLQQLGIDTLVLESSARVGGMVRTEKVSGFQVEWGPNTFLPDAETLRFLEETQLRSDLITANPHEPRFIYVNDRLRRVPFGPMSVRGLARMCAEPFIRSRGRGDESISEFFRRRVGDEAHDRLVAPFVTGIYAGDTRVMSVSATFPRLVALEREYGSIVLGMLRSPKKEPGARRVGSSSFTQGMETLPLRLTAPLKVQFNESHHSLNEARATVIATPAFRAVEILEHKRPALARLFETVEYAPMLIAATSLPEGAFDTPLRGFGFLVPRSEGLHLLGTLFSSVLFTGRAPAGRMLFTSFVGGAFEPEAVDWPDDRVWEVVCSELKRVLRVSRMPEPVIIFRLRRAIPQYRIGHERWVASVGEELERIPGLFITGNYIGGVSVPACIAQGESTARTVAEYLRRKR